MNFARALLGRFLGVLIYVLGYLTSICLAFHLDGTELINCIENFKNPITLEDEFTSKLFLYLENNDDPEFNCNQILERGRYNREPNGMFSYSFLKKEICGWDCVFERGNKENCIDMYLVATNKSGLKCTRWTDPTVARALELADISESNEALQPATLEWRDTIISTLKCKIKENINEFVRDFRSPFIILKSNAFSALPSCSSILVDEKVRIDSDYDRLNFTLTRGTHYICYLDGKQLLAKRIITNTRDNIHCEEGKLHEKMRHVSHSLQEKELIHCNFTNFHESHMGVLINTGSTKRPFIYIDKNEAHGQLECSDIIKDADIQIFEDQLHFNLTPGGQYTCYFDGIQLIAESVITDYRVTIDCEITKPQEKKHPEEHPVLKKEMIDCDFINFQKDRSDKMMYSSSVKSPFIYINKNEKREKIDCWEIIKDGSVKNYGNKLLEFKLYKEQRSGYKCDFDPTSIIKDNGDSNTLVTNLTGLICLQTREEFASRSNLIDRSIECNFHSIIGEEDCQKDYMETKVLLNVSTNEDEELTCSSIIADAEVNVQANSLVHFRLYKPEFSGYVCDLEHREIKDEKGIWLVISRANKMLRCRKQKRITKLACWITGFSDAYSAMRPVVKINAESTRQIRCSDILISAKVIATDSENEAPSPNAVLEIYSEQISRLKCDFKNVDYEERKFIIGLGGVHHFKMNLESELNCADYL